MNLELESGGEGEGAETRGGRGREVVVVGVRGAVRKEERRLVVRWRFGRVVRVGGLLAVFTTLGAVASKSPLVGDELEDEREVRSDPLGLLLDERVCGSGNR